MTLSAVFNNAGNLVGIIDDFFTVAAMGGDVRQLSWPYDGSGGMWAEKRLAQHGIRCCCRRWPNYLQRRNGGGSYGLSVKANQYEWAYEVLITYGFALQEPPPTARLARLAADPVMAAASRPRWTWGKPVRNIGFAGIVTNAWRGDMSIGTVTREQYIERGGTLDKAIDTVTAVTKAGRLTRLVNHVKRAVKDFERG